MIIFLALLSLFTFLLSLPFLAWNTSDTLRKLVSANKENDGLKEAYEKAKENGDDDAIELAENAYLKSLGGGCGTVIYSCLVAMFGLIGTIILAVAEVTVIVVALALHVGAPFLGYIALIIWTINLIYVLFIYPKQLAKKNEATKAIGNTYIPETNYFAKGFFWFPDLYALYIVLVIIGLLV
ncbi:MAG: hypothetical protein UX08_C0025G0004 [Candidatus Collierbacteria bacterium GW2011_GWB1_45_35]|uniref:Uncharacterized protein n=2 Tax=Candidatus Collieribacteriota TaxID=1752725 RepID=A0A0G1KNY5_9BACT|nr:MAG: hypothetical protein UW48_C0017G0005 [Microgenomates group bacterium GW2011_GWC1_44_23]KKT85185.1 MAG: hypothetical protein UW84_C0040G0009 [Candidatus Collierbacteria bacterium GW2011_GWA2_44_99]KKT94574.1 MAG: hypothetical protein UW96_C0019G0019 [Candidatus Collierbacteria bacterium GW2011_GWA1_45_15]KKT99644.1 MAG: hypothetical protein UX01_C0008G0012 [Candidatus Collierbacteria bacterium GW2011_GWB2_45_17]KKU04463.1 MAG: hypothetical protein UX08_C0025G0004 [Candidatus Collierbacte